MIGSLDPSQRRVTILGAGISGLVCAYVLDREGWEVTLLESTSRAGGMISTHQTPFGIAEAAAHSILVTEPVGALLSELGVEMVEVRKDSRARYVLRDGSMKRLPLSFPEILQVLWKASTSKGHAESVTDMEAWADRHLGKAGRKNLIVPMARGIYGAPLSQLDQAAAFPKLTVPPGKTLLATLTSRRTEGGSSKFKSRMMAPAGGMGALTGAIERTLLERLGSRFKKKHPVTSLPDTPNLISTVPASVAASLLRDHDAELALALSQVRYTPLAAVTIFAEDIGFRKGVGVLMSETELAGSEPLDTLGILFNSSSFPGRAKNEPAVASFTSMLRIGSGATDAGIEEVARREFSRVMSRSVGRKAIGKILHCSVSKWQQAIPLYDTRLRDIWSLALESGHWCSQPGRILFGNYTGQVSLRGMIESAVSMAAQLHSV